MAMIGPYSLGALLKAVLGGLIIAVVYNFVNVYQNPAIGLGFGFLGVFLLVWGVSYFLFLGARRGISQDSESIRASASYKMSLLLGVYVMCNITLMIIDQRVVWSALALLGGFIFLYLVMLHGYNKQRTRY